MTSRVKENRTVICIVASLMVLGFAIGHDLLPLHSKLMLAAAVVSLGVEFAVIILPE